MFYIQGQGCDTGFADDMKKTLGYKTKRTGLLAGTCAYISKILTGIFNIGPDQLPGLSGNGP